MPKESIVEMNILDRLSGMASSSDMIDPALYEKYDVKRGLRDLNGKGVVCGLTEISEIQSFQKNENGESIPCEGILCYRGINIKDLVNGFMSEKRFGFEETIYLLLFGELPNKTELAEFTNLLAGFRLLPRNFVRDIIMKASSKDMMNQLARSVLALYSYDSNPDDISVRNVLSQVLRLTSAFPQLAVYGYQTYKYYHKKQSLVIRSPKEEYSIAQNILYMLRDDGRFTDLEARLLDICLVLHAEHGGGNNSTFTTHVVSSSGTDTYSSIAASLGSLKGPKHGGANVKVVRMFDDMRANIKDYSDGSIRDYIAKLLNKEAFDNAGLVYGMGHAVYSLSDPRCDILRGMVGKLAKEKGKMELYDLYSRVEKIAAEMISEKRRIYKGVSANIDFYSGFVYSMLNLPKSLYTPMFAVSRIAGWGAHRIEEICNNNKIIRPAYINVAKRKEYVALENR